MATEQMKLHEGMDFIPYNINAENIDLLMGYKGPLTVNIKGLGSLTPDLYDDGERINTILDYIAQTAVSFGTNTSTGLGVETNPSDWKVLSFDRLKRIIEVEQIGGRPIKDRWNEMNSEEENMYLHSLFDR